MDGQGTERTSMICATIMVVAFMVCLAYCVTHG